MSERSFVRHGSCPECGSKDNLAIYDDGYVKCFGMGCEYYAYGDKPAEDERRSFDMENLEFLDIETRPIQSRKIRLETCELYGYGFAKDKYGNPCHAYPIYNRKGEVIGQKLRYPNKKFRFIGDTDNCQLFGQNFVRDNGTLVITEGEIDAMSVSQVRDNRWPVVSIVKGCASAVNEVKNNIDFISKFEKVIIMFDNDEAGKEAAQKVAEIIDVGKAHIATLPMKDANECLVSGKHKAIMDAIYGAKSHRPDGIILGSEIELESLQTVCQRGLQYPYPKLDAMMHGHRKREITLLTAGSGIGKSTIATAIKFHLMQQTPELFGNIYLEESVEKTATRDIALNAQIALGLLRENPTSITPEMWAKGKEIVNRQAYFKHFGSLDSDYLINQMNYMHKALGVNNFVLDHISMVVSGREEKGSSERKDLDVLMTNLRSFVERTDAHILGIVHLKRNSDKKSFNEGGQISLTDLRGSAAIEQLSDNIIAAERNQQDESAKNLIQLRVLKCREFGETGLADKLAYDPKTGLINVVTEAEEQYDMGDMNIDALY